MARMLEFCCLFSQVKVPLTALACLLALGAAPRIRKAHLIDGLF